MDEKILWGLIGVVATIIGTFGSNLLLKQTEFRLGWEKLQMEKLQELHGLVAQLDEQNRKLFKGSIDPNHSQLRNRLVKWLEAYSESRIFFLKNRIIFSQKINSQLAKSVDSLHEVAVKIMKERNSLDELEGKAGGDINYMYGDESNELLQAKKTIEVLAKTSSVEEIFQNIKHILKNIDWEFRQIVDQKSLF